MAFDLSSLPSYVEQHASELKLKAYYSAKTLTLPLEFMTGIKGPTTINKLGTQVILQGGGCGWNASGTTTLTQRTITPGDYKVNQSFCPKDLENYFTRKYLPKGQGYEGLPGEVESAFMDAFMGEIGQVIETALWQSDTTSTNENLNKFDGFNKVLDAASGLTISTGATSGWSKATSLDILDGIWSAIPLALREKDNLVCLIGIDKATQYGFKLRDLNLFHFDGKEVATFEYIHPGTTMKVIGIPGLNGVNRIYAGQLDNFVVSFDDEWESTPMKMFYAVEADEIRFKMANMTGTNVAYPDQIVRQITT